ncbi:glycosyltransferase WbsX family protein [Flavobacterium hercynium]|uniref:Lipopolysaccharide biosynthesis protein n=1 Tax=Flavobacterium hercynium TaxID=387094 RepID=A0A226HCX9_9FLAO|nr:glycoside hydrolase family 99-like domain-containing protein [Flavobacterium hercynium]OXA92189.1 lipopolysaccharide biosynthesis protein [Flavobacterium hercynium]SMP24532.1 Glycosyltransferase WbsX [Flavobacterium hercynium]
MGKKARVIAFYLPQYHPIAENDKWWGKGFTEWTNVGKAKPLFRGHYQPRVPADLGYYDLRVPEVRQSQADMAREYGVEGFCYWHYWFGNGKRLIERPFNEVVSSGEPNFPFCLAWANETWKGFDHGLNNRNILIEQLYPGLEDYKAHFYELLSSFKDERYIKVNDKLLFMIYKPLASKEISVFMEVWKELAIENNLPGFFFVGHHNDLRNSLKQIEDTGVDAVNTTRLNNYIINYRSFSEKAVSRIKKFIWGTASAYAIPYKIMSKYFIVPEEDKKEHIFPSIIPGWDHTPRSGKEGLVMTGSTPEWFESHVKEAVNIIQNKKADNKIIFIKSWNEWAEGNYMEPDLKWGKKYLEALKRQIFE